LNYDYFLVIFQLENIVNWIMISCPKPLQLVGLSLRDFVENGLSKRFFTPVLENLVKRRQKGLLHLVNMCLIYLIITLTTAALNAKSATAVIVPLVSFKKLFFIHVQTCQLFFDVGPVSIFSS